MALNNKMGQRHEGDLLKVLGGRGTRGSGSTWKDQMDGRQNRRDVPFAYAWDGKSTLGKSISVSRAMWAKAREQAGGERPMLALRFYDTERLDVDEDLVVVGLHDFAEMQEAANRREPVRIFLFQPPADPFAPPFAPLPRREIVVVRDGRVQRDIEFSITKISQRDEAEVRLGSELLRGPVEVYYDGLPFFVGVSAELSGEIR